MYINCLLDSGTYLCSILQDVVETSRLHVRIFIDSSQLPLLHLAIRRKEVIQSTNFILADWSFVSDTLGIVI